jgi:hypothetical protein
VQYQFKEKGRKLQAETVGTAQAKICDSAWFQLLFFVAGKARLDKLGYHRFSQSFTI